MAAPGRLHVPWLFNLSATLSNINRRSWARVVFQYTSLPSTMYVTTLNGHKSALIIAAKPCRRLESVEQCYS